MEATATGEGRAGWQGEGFNTEGTEGRGTESTEKTGRRESLCGGGERLEALFVSQGKPGEHKEWYQEGTPLVNYFIGYDSNRLWKVWAVAGSVFRGSESVGSKIVSINLVKKEYSMATAKSVRLFLIGLAVCGAVSMVAVAARRDLAVDGQSGVPGAKVGEQARMAVREKIAFRFDIANLVTNHQLEGQRNTFHVEYEYAGTLKGAGYDLKGHEVAANTYPYFQSVRQDIIRYIQEYSDKKDFYELFGTNICHFVLEKYPQIRRIKLTIEIPAYKEIDVDRSEEIEMMR